MRYWMNLYSFLIDHVNARYCFGNYTQRQINTGNITVNHQTPDNLNMDLKLGDIVTVDGIDYIVEQKHFM